MPAQSLNRGGNNLDLPFTASIRRKENFSSGLKNVDRSSLITNKEKGTKDIVPSRMRITKRKQTPFARCLMKKMKQ